MSKAVAVKENRQEIVSPDRLGSKVIIAASLVLQNSIEVIPGKRL